MSRSRRHAEPVSTFMDQDIDLETKTLTFDNGGSPDIDLDGNLAMRTVKALRILDRIRPEQPITILVNCEGGDVHSGLMVYDAIQRCVSPVHIEVVGMAYSMAAWVLQAGDIRRATKHSSIMIHDGDAAVSGKKHEMDSSRRMIALLDTQCEDILLARIREVHPRYTRAKLQALLATDTYLTPKQALELGLLDEIVGDAV